MCSDQTSSIDIFAPTGKTCQAHGEGEVCWRAELGPSCWRNADIAAKGRSEGGPAVLRDWIGTLDSGGCTAATIALLGCGQKKPEPRAAYAVTLCAKNCLHCVGGGADAAGRKLRC